MPQSSDQSATTPEREKFPDHSTFSERYGYEPLPEPMRLEYLSNDLRREVFDEIHTFLKKIYRSQDKPTGINLEYIMRILGEIKKIPQHKVNIIFSSVTENFEHILLKEENFNVILDCLEKMINESFSLCKKHIIEIRSRTRKISPNLHNLNEFIESTTGNPLSLFDQKDAKSLYTQSKKFKDRIANLFDKHDAAYRLDTSQCPCRFSPHASQEQGEAIQKAFETLHQSGMNNATNHFRQAAEHIKMKQYADSVADSIHAVESVACEIGPNSNKTLGKALDSLEKEGLFTKENCLLKEALKKLHGYANQSGIRHGAQEGSTVNVGLDEAMLMYGACASFAAYLTQKNQQWRQDP